MTRDYLRMGAILVAVGAMLACTPGDLMRALVSEPTSPPPTATPVPPAQPTATPTPQPEEATQPPVATPTVTPPPTEGPDFSGASVYAVGHLEGNRLLVTLQIPGGVDGVYTAQVGTNPYTCEILNQYPDRLYCSGPAPSSGYSSQQATLQVFTPGGTEPVYATQFTVPPKVTATPTYTEEPTHTPTPTNTP